MGYVRTITGADLMDPKLESFALVMDDAGAWPWYRRDYPSIRTLVELGWDEAWDYEAPGR